MPHPQSVQESVPSFILHKIVDAPQVCAPDAKLDALVEALLRDMPRAAIIFTHNHVSTQIQKMEFG